ncbi:hypothetical protein DPX16_12594 [Anabarilius grahami]|uniref:Uncharacterized protein n=1 Tax=Anabarilius grahami TaxID=495550 RepID=A0A3N0YLE2_ANAGA|nr:hypothetical protein DPX16_12594 [Anabarilius grahami]
MKWRRVWIEFPSDPDRSPDFEKCCPMTSLKKRPGSIKERLEKQSVSFRLQGLFCLYKSYFKSADEGELLDKDDVLSLTSSDPAASAHLAASPREQEMAFEEEAGEPAETSKPPCPAYVELLEVMERASGRLQLPWEHVKRGVACGRLDERFLSGHNKAAPVSLPFLPDLHVEIEKAWKNPYSARIHLHQRANFADMEGLSQHGQGQRSSVASRAPPPPLSKCQRRRDSRKKQQDLREVGFFKRKLPQKGNEQDHAEQEGLCENPA